MKKIALISVGLFVGIPAVFLSTCHYIENPKTKYSTMAEARLKGAVEAGWIPPFVPDSATDIIEQHNIDSNVVYLSFSLPPNDSPGPPCQPIESSSVKWFSSYPIWWPHELRGSNEASTSLNYYYCGGATVGTVFKGRNYIWFSAAQQIAPLAPVSSNVRGLKKDVLTL